MATYKVMELETESHYNVYYIDASSKEEALDKYNEMVVPPDDTVDSETQIDFESIEECELNSLVV